jgi:hypothetical protein
MIEGDDNVNKKGNRLVLEDFGVDFTSEKGSEISLETSTASVHNKIGHKEEQINTKST